MFIFNINVSLILLIFESEWWNAVDEHIIHILFLFQTYKYCLLVLKSRTNCIAFYFRCETDNFVPECPAKLKKSLKQNKHCGLLRDKSGPFSKCIKQNPGLSKEYFDSCVFDLCANSGNNPLARCQSLEAFGEECEELNIEQTWRSSKLCRKYYDNSLTYMFIVYVLLRTTCNKHMI